MLLLLDPKGGSRGPGASSLPAEVHAQSASESESDAGSESEGGEAGCRENAAKAAEFAYDDDRDEEDEEGEEEDEMDEGEKEKRGRWLVSGGKDGRVAIWELMDFGGERG